MQEAAIPAWSLSPQLSCAFRFRWQGGIRPPHPAESQHHCKPTDNSRTAQASPAGGQRPSSLPSGQEQEKPPQAKETTFPPSLGAQTLQEAKQPLQMRQQGFPQPPRQQSGKARSLPRSMEVARLIFPMHGRWHSPPQETSRAKCSAQLLPQQRALPRPGHAATATNTDNIAQG